MRLSPLPKIALSLCIFVPLLMATSLTGATPEDSTWSIRIHDLWDEGQHVDIYPTFAGGGCERAIATSRKFNTSIHLVETCDIQLEGRRFAGRIDILITPDPWMPKDGRPQQLILDIEGRFDSSDNGDFTHQGTYTGTHDGREVSGKISGGLAANETGYANSTWTVDLTPVLPPGAQKQSQIQVSVSLRDGKVTGGMIGCTWRRDPVRKYPFDASRLAYSNGIIEGDLAVPNRVIHLAGDPEARCAIHLTCTRVQGLVGGACSYRVVKAGRAIGKAIHAYGRGTAQKVQGQPQADPPEPIWFHQVDNAAWWIPVEGHRPVKAGEHPRLYFRKDDIPALREKAQTEDGRKIVGRLRLLLGNNGERLPDHFNTTPPHNHAKSGNQPLGTFTSFHPAGYSMLYTLTGNRKYSDLARKSLELMFDGAMDRDNRYGWKTPGTHFRIAPVLAAVGFAYDTCYDAWDERFRRKVALSIQNYNQKASESGGGKTLSLELLAGRTSYPPSSNHYGAMMAACTGVLAILNDPGTDTPRLEGLLEDFERQIPEALTCGYGDRGFYSEGHHPGRIFSNLGLIPMLTALRNVTGRDYILARDHAQWITLHWILEIVLQDGRPRFSHRGPYGGDELDGEGMSHSGDFAHGFAAIDPKYAPALLWAYENYVEPVRPHFGANTYPHRAVAALINWPVGTEPRNPEGLLLKATADTIHGYFINRNRFRDGDDIVITHFLSNGQEGYHRVKDAGKIHIRGLGLSGTVSTHMREQHVTFYRNRPDGSSILSTTGDGRISSLAVDFGETCGADAMIVGVGPAFSKASHRAMGSADGPGSHHTTGTVGDLPFFVTTLQRGQAPKVQVSRDTIRIAEQTVRFDGRRIHLGEL